MDGEQDDRMVDVTYNEDGLPTRERRQEGGVILVDTGRRMMWWSEAMEAALQRSGLRWWRGMRCCDALGCSDESSGCLTDQALLKPEGLDSRPWRADHRGRALEGTVSVRAIRLGKEEMVAFELRFHDAPTQTAPAARDVTVAALGRVSVTVDGRLRDGDWLQQRPGQVFRYLLASRDGAQRSEAIASALWPERGPSAVANVRYCIFKLREQLEGGDPACSVVMRDAAGYRIDPRRVELDVDVFQARSDAGLAAHRRGDSVQAEPMLAEALRLYRGEFLADDPYADWAFSEREFLRALAGKDLAAMAQIAIAGGRLVGATEHLLRLSQLEPFDSHVHQMLIEVCLRRGRRTEALRHYDALRARLHRAFGECPDFELAGLAYRQREVPTRSQRGSTAGLAFDTR